MRVLISVIVLFQLLLHICAIGKDDKVTSIPGLTFKINYDVYSGYLNANNDSTWKMHYWLIESKSNPSTDPLLVWFNGGPGCSSFGGAFEELGPFYVNYDGKTLFENKYSWNAKANVLFLESPIGVGFSYDTTNPDYSSANDEQTKTQNYIALKDFFNRVQPQYKNRTFFLSGESYAGVYIPMLTAQLAIGIKSGDFNNPNFQGAAIGNGFMHVEKLTNALVLWGAYHGKVSMDQWKFIKENCTGGAATKYDVDNYNFTAYLYTENKMDYDTNNSTCGDLINDIINVPDNMDPYNYYQDCYDPKWQELGEAKQHGMRNIHKAKINRIRGKRELMVPKEFLDNTAASINYRSSDVYYGYPCWSEYSLGIWANDPQVQKALHIDDAWRKGANGTTRKWVDCNDPMYDDYTMTYPDMTQFFESFFTNNMNENFRFLIYNGDVDTVCNYLGDAWFIDQLKTRNNLTTKFDRMRWMFSDQTSGFVQRFAGTNVLIDLLTVKGAGHFVPTDRPGAALQMITNFVSTTNQPNYNSTEFVKPFPSLAPLLNNPPATDDTKASFYYQIYTAIMICLVNYLFRWCL